MMTLSEITKNYYEGWYSYEMEIPKKVWENHIFDEDLSVKRNREMVKEHNDNVDRLNKETRQKQNELDLKLKNDIIKYLVEEYLFSETVAEKVEAFVSEKYHSFMSDYFSNIDDYAMFIRNILDAK